MTMNTVLGRQQRGFIDRIRMHMEDMGFPMVDPDDSRSRHEGSSVGFSDALSEHP